ncbi:hypothetical protein JHK85_029510 [Glycine max]|nr:hypothetical protein JHK85_029510 [Glycine max]KAG5004826.1 hypothetical protein JHK86_028965 [Glycine max]
MRSLNLSDNDLSKLLKKFPEVLGCNLEEELKGNVKILEEQWSIKGNSLRKLLLRNPKVLDCVGKCNYRCSKAGRNVMCLRACNACCQRCNCVPPGTSGNRDLCPCYARLTTHGGHLKCP